MSRSNANSFNGEMLVCTVDEIMHALLSVHSAHRYFRCTISMFNRCLPMICWWKNLIQFIIIIIIILLYFRLKAHYRTAHKLQYWLRVCNKQWKETETNRLNYVPISKTIFTRTFACFAQSVNLYFSFVHTTIVLKVGIHLLQFIFRSSAKPHQSLLCVYNYHLWQVYYSQKLLEHSCFKFVTDGVCLVTSAALLLRFCFFEDDQFQFDFSRKIVISIRFQFRYNHV